MWPIARMQAQWLQRDSLSAVLTDQLFEVHHLIFRVPVEVDQPVHEVIGERHNVLVEMTNIPISVIVL